MSPKLILWLVFSMLSSTWFALDPDARGPFFEAPIAAGVVADVAPAQVPRIVGN
jgi:hypothetical protein